MGTKTVDCVIVGGGITGLTAAYRLRRLRPEWSILLLEAGERLGGKLKTERVGEFVVEASADSFLARKPAGIALVEELGLADQIQGRRPENRKTFVQRHGNLYRLPEGLTGLIPTNLDALYAHPLLSPEAAARVAQEPTLPIREGDEDESVGDFISRRMGRELYENLVEPLMGGIYGGRADLLSLQAVFPQLRNLELTHGSLLKGLTQPKKTTAAPSYPPFVSFKGGIGTLVDRLAAALDGVEVRTGCAVESVMELDGGWEVVVDGGEGISAENLILTTPAYITSKLLANNNPELSNALAAIPHSSAAIVTLAFNKADIENQLNGYGYVIPRIEGKEILACTWSSQKWGNRAPERSVLLRVYLGRYGVDVTAYEDSLLIGLAKAELAGVLGISAEATLTTLHRWKNSIPQYMLGHLDRIAKIRTLEADCTGLHLAGAYFDGVGIPDCIRHGDTVARKITNRRG
ncbi:MAG: protoporphyrinogen oxidase [Candidatus Promineifilaceae bacterium]